MATWINRSFRFPLAAASLMAASSLLLQVAAAANTLEVLHREMPALRGKAINPVMGFEVRSSESAAAGAVEFVEISLLPPTPIGSVAQVHLLQGADPAAESATILSSATPAGGVLRLTPKPASALKESTFWIAVTLTENVNIDARLHVQLERVRAGGKALKPAAGAARAQQRVGVALRQRGDDGSNAYRIPALARTNAGTLVAAYDIRREHCRDLPARIDVGVSRSTDGGQTWSPMSIGMSPASLGARYASGGLGDPAVLVDRANGRIWMAALWAHGNIGWESSRPGMNPEETGQLLVTFSDDDGLTWAPLRNLTPSVKDPAWRLCFVSPGAGICMQDGTLVFPAMFRAADGGVTQGKPFATILWSRDQGANWKIGTGAKIDTTESQVVELADGSLMLNARDNRGETRTVMTTRDLGATWQPHATDRAALEDPVCMAGLLRWKHPRHGDLIIFSNPASTTQRSNMTLKISRDQGNTWPQELHRVYDGRAGSGYSCLAPASDEHIGVLYEGRCEIYFVRIPLRELIR